MKNRLLDFSLLLLILTLAGCIGPGRSPHTFLPPIAEEYYACEKCGSLHGGIYGKGPLVGFAGERAESCWHHWHQIPKADFQRRAEANYPKQWALTDAYFKPTKPFFVPR